MPEPAVRGSWTIHEGIVEKWADSQMDAFIRGLDQWAGKPASERDDYLPLNDGAARPRTPFPYVVYEVGEPVRIGGDGGRTHDQHEHYWAYRVTFTVHARTKPVAQRVAVAVANQYEDKLLCVTPDGWIATTPVADVAFREDDENWAWRLVYEVVVSSSHLTNRG